VEPYVANSGQTSTNQSPNSEEIPSSFLPTE
jgi:hypothetical protein